VIDYLESWHDKCIFHTTHFFVNSLPKRLWILGDNVFPLIPGRVERLKKKKKGIFNNLQCEDFQQQLKSFSRHIRISSEWGVKDLKHSWFIISKKMPSNNKKTKKLN
jgi:hypothetical protein